jgi:hypothetical protein
VGRLLDHPAQGDVGRPPLRLWVAATDVGVVARGPHLNEGIALVFDLIADAVPTGLVDGLPGGGQPFSLAGTMRIPSRT